MVIKDGKKLLRHIYVRLIISKAKVTMLKVMSILHSLHS